MAAISLPEAVSGMTFPKAPGEVRSCRFNAQACPTGRVVLDGYTPPEPLDALPSPSCGRWAAVQARQPRALGSASLESALSVMTEVRIVSTHPLIRASCVRNSPWRVPAVNMRSGTHGMTFNKRPLSTATWQPRHITRVTVCVHYANGQTEYFVLDQGLVPAEGPALMALVEERQSTGLLPDGIIAAVTRAR